MKKILVSLATVMGFGLAAMAAEWEIDPVHSSIDFSVRHLMISNVKGGFAQFAGKATYDPANPASFAIEGSIQADSISTANEMRDKHLKSPDFLDTAKHPAITFKSKALKKTGEGEYELTGDLSLHGVTNTITLKASGLAAPVSFSGSTRIGLSVTGQIERDKFGLTWNKALETGGAVVGNTVQVAADIELVEKKAK